MNKGPNCPRTRSAAPQCGQRLMSMSKVTYCANEKKQRGGRYVWGVLRQEGRKQQFRTVGEGE